MITISWDFFGMASQIFKRSVFYLTFALAPMGAIVFDLCYMTIQRIWSPSSLDIVQELETKTRERQKQGLRVTWDFEVCCPRTECSQSVLR